MSGFKFKDLIFKSDEKDDKKKENNSKTPKEDNVKFPDQSSSSPSVASEAEMESDPFISDFPTPEPVFEGDSKTVPNACKPYIDKVMKMYEEGFNRLNQDGYDFFEYMQAVISGGINNPQVYQMAFNMGKGMIPTLTKNVLVDQSEFYLREIEKVYQLYADQGVKKKEELMTQKQNEEKQLRSNVEELEQTIARLQTELQHKKDTLNGIDKRYHDEITELECKSQANQLARNKIVGKIEQVVQGIGNNVKS